MAGSTRGSKKALPPELVRIEWLRRVEAEYRSATITQELTLWLMQIGASPDLIKLGLRIAGDEMAHAELSFNAYQAAGGDRAPELARETLGLRRSPGESLERDVTRACVDVFCLGETVAVPLFKNLRERCDVPAARRVLDRVLRDEVRHRDFGWLLFEWLLSLPIAHDLHDLTRRELPSFFLRLHETYANANAARVTEIGEEEQRWGLMAPARYRAILERTFDRDWRPRFSRLNLDPAPAWQAARARWTGANPTS